MHTISWEKALHAMENGEKVKRVDWGYADHAFLFLEYFNHAYNFYLKGAYNFDVDMIEGYGLTYNDIKSTKWIIL